MKRTTTPFKKLEHLVMRNIVMAFAGHACSLSLEDSYVFADRFARFLSYAYPPLRFLAMRHLHIAYGEALDRSEISSLAMESIRNMCRMAVEVARMRDLTPEELSDTVRIQGTENLDQALAAGKGAILVTAHYGNWEMLGARIVQSGYPLAVIVRDHEDSGQAEFMNRIRRKFGLKVILRDEVRRALECLKRNEIVGILPDQNTMKGGVFVPFFGRPASTAPGPAVLARRTGARVVTGFITRDEQCHHHAVIHPPVELALTNNPEHDALANTALITELIEQQIRTHPEEWLWVHRRWKLTERMAARRERRNGQRTRRHGDAGKGRGGGKA